MGKTRESQKLASANYRKRNIDKGFYQHSIICNDSQWAIIKIFINWIKQNKNIDKIISVDANDEFEFFKLIYEEEQQKSL